MKLHSDMADHHHLHHTAKYVSFSMNFFFHPLDLLLEFSAPPAVVLVANKLFFHDDWAALVALVAINTWYGLGHDEYMQLPHARHHFTAVSPYNAYLDTKVAMNDGVRKTLVSGKSAAEFEKEE